MDSKRIGCQLFMSRVDFLGDITMHRLLKHFPGGAVELYELSDAAIRACKLLNKKQAEYMIQNRKKWEMGRAVEELVRKGIRICTLEDQEYPPRLRDIVDAPYLLYYYGELPDPKIPSVSIIGARMCSAYGREMAKYFSGGLAQKGVQVISGLASGIDGIAQREALYKGGKSFGILGSGVDCCYPASNRDLYEELKVRGGLISEFVPGAKPEAFHFPRRNRIISGLADCILVVEAKEKSGTAITVSMALEQGREVFAVPGRVQDPLSRGCNQMIRDGAGMALEVEDVLDAITGFGWYSSGEERLCNYNLVDKFAEGSLPKNILRHLQNRKYSSEDLYAALLNNRDGSQRSLSYDTLICELRRLELEDYIVERGGFWEIVCAIQ